ncbi:MAG: hypothetical protein S4CHLAM102_08980 [Chlamydiia bacterium]|nr:hypothetical protein [Chlamydiia bacterium]
MRSGRIVQIDVLRGILLFTMSLNHLVLLPFISIPTLYQFILDYSYNAYGYFSNSEGFYFLAGVTGGIVYGKRLLRGEWSSLWERIWKRVRLMYLMHALLITLFAIGVALFPHYHACWKKYHILIWVWHNTPGIHYFIDNPLPGWLMGLCFLYSPPFMDILPLYILYMVLTPWVLKLLDRGKTGWVLGGSAALWLVCQYTQPGYLEAFFHQWIFTKLGWFDPFAVQLLFFGGMTLGFHIVKGTKIPVGRVIGFVALVLALLYPLFKLTGVDLGDIQRLSYDRVLVFSIKALLAYALFRFWTFGPLALLGRHSLYIFTYHVALCYGLASLVTPISELPLALQLLGLGLCLLSLFGVAAFLEARSKRIQVARALS